MENILNYVYELMRLQQEPVITQEERAREKLVNIACSIWFANFALLLAYLHAKGVI